MSKSTSTQDYALFRRKTFGFSLGLLLTATLSVNNGNAQDQKASQALTSWRELKLTSQLSADQSVGYYAFDWKNGLKVHLCVLDLASKKYALKPTVNSPTNPTSVTATKSGALMAVNGGFFNLSNGESTSFVYVGGKQVCDPTTNKDLTNNPKLQPFLDTIFNRSELRIMQGKNNSVTLGIAAHKDLTAKETKVVHILQGGPQLLPKLTSKEEAFIRTGTDGKLVDSIGCERTAARTACGVTADNFALIVCIPGKGQDEFASGITLRDLSQLLKELGATTAINFDGGTSTTMVIADSSAAGKTKMVCGKTPETRVKSVLMIVPAK
ncbi:MAG: phosphodiester glycosidase family protein [Leptolyngbya sp.]|nr:phosphodiester glycosidase family protein [Candidatus Melainabacteria bacterium]